MNPMTEIKEALEWALENTTCEERLQADKFNILANAITACERYIDLEKPIEVQQDIKNIVTQAAAKGNIVVATFEGLQSIPLKEFVKQPVDGMLYDLNRNEAVVLTFIKDPKWINDYAVAKVIQELKRQLDDKN